MPLQPSSITSYRRKRITAYIYRHGQPAKEHTLRIPFLKLEKKNRYLCCHRWPHYYFSPIVLLEIKFGGQILMISALLLWFLIYDFSQWVTTAGASWSVDTAAECFSDAWRTHIWKEKFIVYINLSPLLPLVTNFYFSLVRYLFFLISPTGCDTEKKGQESAVATASDAIGMK